MKQPTLAHRLTLLFYDVPQVIVLQDRLERPYLGFLLSDSEPRLPYILAPISANTFHAVAAGRTTYREALRNSNESQCLIISTGTDDFSDIEIVKSLPFEDVPEDYWPDEGAARYIRAVAADSLEVTYSRYSPLLVELSIDPPESGLSIGRFSELLGRAHQFIKSLAGFANSTRPLLNIAVPASAGSLKVLLEQDYQLGLFPHDGLDQAMRGFTRVISEADDPEKVAAFFESVPPAAANSFKEFIQVLKGLNSGLSLRSEPFGKPPSSGTTTRYAIRSLIDWIGEGYNETVTEVTYRGTFAAMDLDQGTWRLSHLVFERNDAAMDQPREVRGKTSTDNHDVLRDLVSGANYDFRCAERRTLDPLTQEPKAERTLLQVTGPLY